MPIGKNSIKRVKNNGYANVESKAPDMENSTVLVPDAQTVKLVENMVAEGNSAKKASKSGRAAAAKGNSSKTAAKSATQKSAAKGGAGRKAAVRSASAAKPMDAKSEKKTEEQTSEGVNAQKTYVNLGDAMPEYLL